MTRWRSDHVFPWLLIAVLLLAAGLYIQDMAHAPLWIDEAYGIEASSQPDLQAVWDFLRGDIHPPLFYSLQHFNPYLTEQLLSVRIGSYFLAIIGVAATYRLCADVFNRRTALVAAALVATSDLVISMAPLFRFYAPYMTLAVLATWFYWRYSQKWNLRWGTAYTVIAVILPYTLYYGGFVLIGHGLHTLIYHRKKILYMVVPAVILGLVYVPWLSYLSFQVSEGLPDSGYHSAVALNADGLIIILFQLFGVSEALFITLSAAGVVGAFGSHRWQDYLPDRRTMLFACQFIALLALPAAIDLLFNYSALNFRSMVALVPMMAVLIGHVLAQMNAWEYMLLLIALLGINLTTTGADSPPHGPWHEASLILREYSHEGDLVLIETTDVLQFYAISQHLKLDDVPHWDRARWLHESILAPQSENLAMYRPSVWLLEYWDDPVLGAANLTELGYEQVTPLINSPPGDGGPIRMAYFAYPPPESVQLSWEFGSELALVDYTLSLNGLTLNVDLLWQAEAVPSADYTVSIFLLDENMELSAQHDEPPLDSRSPTSTWQPGRLYFDRHRLPLAGITPGSFQLGVQVYTWPDLNNLPATPCETDFCTVVILDEFDLDASLLGE